MSYATTAALLSALIGSSAAQELPVPCASCAGVGNFVTSGAATYSTSGNTGTINQTTDRAILNWQSFNIGTGNTVQFNQPSSTSAALNRIHQNDPSRILGNLRANGEVYLINQNGIIFGQGAQVNTGSLTASTLNVSDDVFKNSGITGAINQERAAPAFAGDSKGGVIVEKGATLRAGKNGRVLLIGSDVINKGRIETPDGQALLVGAKDKVYVAADSDVRGLLVEVDTGGTATNLGEIISERGNTSMVGLAVNQSGRVTATTSVNLKGTIRLSARDGASDPGQWQIVNGKRTPLPTRTGTVTLGAGSNTEVLPEASSETAVDTVAQPKSQVDIMARTVKFDAGARVRVPGGKVVVQATSSPQLPLSGGDRSAAIYVAPGASIDVSGDTSTVVPMARNQSPGVKLLGDVVADSPLVRQGPLARKEVFFDLRKGTSLANVKAFQEAIKRTVAERLATGGEVQLQAEGDVVLKPGSLVDFSGGKVEYLGGVIATTWLVTRTGQLVEISDADPGMPYAGFFGERDVPHPKWAVTETYRLSASGISAIPSFNPGYIEGKDAGLLSIESRAGGVELAGDLRGFAQRGRLQRSAPTAIDAGSVRAYDEVPLSGKLAIASNMAGVIAPTVATPGVAFGQLVDSSRPLVLDPGLFPRSGINRLSLSAGGSIVVPGTVQLDLDPGGELELRSERVTVAGRIRSAQGTVSLISSASQQGNIELSPTAEIDVSGQWVNDSRLLNPGGDLAPDFSSGGSVTINSIDNLALARGSRIDVRGGARLDADGRIQAGDAGSVSLASRPGANNRTRLVLDGELLGYGLEQGGKLKLDGNGFRIGNASGTDAEGNLLLSPDFFTSKGFADFAFTARYGGFEIADGTRVLISPLNSRLLANFAARPTGSDIEALTEVAALPDYLRGESSLSVNVARTEGVPASAALVRLGRGAHLQTEVGGSIALTSDSDIQIDGTLQADAGDINLTLGTPSAENETGFRADQAIRLGRGARLLARGASELQPSDQGFRIGTVLDGGNVSIQADRGYVIAAAGSVVDVSGVEQTLDLPIGDFGLLQPATVASRAGSIAITAAEGLQLGGLLRGAAGNAGAQGGRLSLTLNAAKRDPAGAVANNPGLNQFLASPPQFVVGATTPGYVELGAAVDNSLNGLGFANPDLVRQGAFDVLELKAGPAISGTTAIAPGSIRFDGNIDLGVGRALRLDAPVIASSGGSIRIAAPYVAMGSTDTVNRVGASAVAGSGALTVDADHIDLVGPLTLSGFDGERNGRPSINLTSRNDIRAIGVRNSSSESSLGEPGALNSAVSLALKAAQIYPATLTDYSINVSAADGRILVAGNGIAPAPLSAAGSLTLSANRIVQGGVLRAPFGAITLNGTEQVTLAPGSITSTSGLGQVIPFGQTEFGEDWVYPLTGLKRLFDRVPEKRIALNSSAVQVDQGSVLDLRGGGELTAYEFTPGPGGSKDLLSSINERGSFAVIPGYANRYGVHDPLESPGSGIEPGRTIHLAGGSGLAAGEYVVLPARYALLPGAYLITPTGLTDVSPRTSQTLADGTTPIVAGQFAYTDTRVRDDRWAGFVVENGTQLRERVDYIESKASEFFGSNAVTVTADAGRLTIDAERSAALRGSLLAAAAAGGRGAQVDLVADNIAVVGAATGAAGRVEFLQNELNALSAESLFLGGRRTSNADGSTNVDVASGSVTIAAGVSLSGKEIIAAARDDVTISGGARLVAQGAAINRGGGRLVLNGDGALARVSTGAQVRVDRSNVTGTTGRLGIEAGSVLSATGSITLDATADLVSAGTLAGNGGSVGLNASRISLGDTAGVTGGLVLSGAQLATLAGGELLLSSRSTIDLYGGLDAAFETLGLDAAGLRGFANSGATATLTADRIALSNRTGVASAAGATGTGNLVLSAREVTLSNGALAVDGFDSVRVIGADQIIGSGRTGLSVDGSLSLEASRLTAEKGADIGINAAGNLSTVRTAAQTSLAPAAALGAKLALTGAEVRHGSDIVLHSGRVSLTASGAGGDVELENGSGIDVSGVDREIGTTRVSSGGGAVSLIARNGGVTVADSARVDVSGAPSAADAGEIVIVAGAEALEIAARAIIKGNAAATYRGGAVGLDVAGLQGGFSNLNTVLNAGGFDRERTLRQRNGNITVAGSDVINAKAVSLIADRGGIDVAGTVNAVGADGGRIRLLGRDDVRLRDSARLAATATANGGKGGEVELSTVDGRIAIDATSGAGEKTIDVSGRDQAGNETDSGDVRIRARRAGANGVNIASLAGTIDGAASIDIEAFRVYENVASLNPTTYSTIASETATYMANAGAIRSALGVAADPRYRLVAGEELRSSGDMTLSQRIDLQTRRYNGAAGVLTLRAAGDINVNASLSDGFAAGSVGGQASRDVVQTGPSWSYRIAAGADVQSADALAVNAGAGNVSIAANTHVRTGTGDIDVAAGGDINLTAATSTIYTIGENRGHGAVDPVAAELLLRGDFVGNGGDVRVAAAGNVNGVIEQVLPDWMPRFGGQLLSTTNPALRDIDFPAMWAIAAEKFRQGVGALGGGDVSIRAGGDITGVSAAVATTGLPLAMDGSQLDVSRGGDLLVRADGDVRGGVFSLMKGEGEIRAGGAVRAVDTSRTTSAVAPILQVGDAVIDVSARSGAEIETAFNPTVAEQDPRQGVTGRGLNAKPSYFFTYSDRSAVNVSTVAGDAVVAGRVGSIETLAARNLGSVNDALHLYPGTLRTSSLEGAVIVDGDIQLFPAAAGNLELTAEDDITSNAAGSILMSDGDINLLPRTSSPAQVFDNSTLGLAILGNAPAPVHAGDNRPVLIASRAGDVGPRGNGELTISVPKQARVFAGRDVRNLNLAVQHDDAGDFSIVEAGRDVIFPTVRNGVGNIDVNGRRIEVNGPGLLQVLAGRDVDLGASDGIETRGNLNNSALPDGGADISILTGLAAGADFNGFFNRYVRDRGDYRDELAAFLANYPQAQGADDLARFGSLDVARQREFLLSILFAEVRKAGIAATTGSTAEFARGYSAIAALFPNKPYPGDLRSFLSKITTLDGGDINLVVPGGLINAGVASSTALSKSADKLGIVIQRDGNINAVVDGDFLVNQSRVFALDGGDIMIWSSSGDIDAGRGAKTALAIPPPVVSFDAKGNVSVEFPPAISGSGIRGAVSTTGRSPGDVFLFAPAGIVNAGDAGIESAGNITVAAVQVVGADNISAGGTAVGVPTVSTSSLAAGLAGGGDVAAAATNSVTDNATANQQGDNGKAAKDAATALASALSFISVEFLGYGEG